MAGFRAALGPGGAAGGGPEAVTGGASRPAISAVMPASAEAERADRTECRAFAGIVCPEAGDALAVAGVLALPSPKAGFVSMPRCA